MLYARDIVCKGSTDALVSDVAFPFPDTSAAVGPIMLSYGSDMDFMPRESSAVLVSDINRAATKQWIDGYAKARHPKALVLIGPAGVGKSSLATLCLQEASYTIIHIAADAFVGKVSLIKSLTDATKSPLKQAALIEDPEALVKDGSLTALRDFTKRKSKVPIIVIANNSKKSNLQPLLRSSEVLSFRALPAKVLAAHFGVNQARCVGGDLRQLSMQQLPTMRDVRVDIPEAATNLLAGQSVHDGLHQYRVDATALTNLIQCNYVHLTDSIHVASAAANDISLSDVLGKDDFDQMGTDIAGVVGPVQAGQRIQKAPTRLQPDIVWTKHNFRLQRQKALKECSHHFQAAGTHVDIDSLQSLRAAFLPILANTTQMKRWAPTASLQHFTAIMRSGLTSDDKILSKIRRAFKKETAILKVD